MVKQWLGAITFEFGSIVILFSNTAGTGVLLAYFASHAAGSALLALVLLPLVPDRYSRPRVWLFAFLFAFNFFAPIAGLVCILGGLAFGYLVPRTPGSEAFGKVSAPRFNTHRNAEGTGFRGGQVRAQLANESAPMANRLQALAAVQNTPARMTGALLRELLADPVDDVRLLAYGMLDGKEKAISGKILAAREALAALTSGEDLRVTHKQIAEYYWELVYQNLVQGDMKTFAAGEAVSHARKALEIDADDAGLWFMLGRLALATAALADAESALARAQSLGFPRERIMPYLAELLFTQKRYSEVRLLFGELRGKPAPPALNPLRRYWGPV